ncbi:MAG: SusC/RagA family TonB-linked outer membrane protein [Bacteroidales bacterium]|nr:SusC/RagA family TonB-linked outer membrane protein [Bacteroidales bacterium]
MNKLILIWTLIFLLGSSFAKGEILMQQGSAEVPLENVVKSLEKKFDVSVTYEISTGVTVTQNEATSIINSSNIDKALNNLAKDNGLKIKKLRNDYYVLFQEVDNIPINDDVKADSSRTITGVITDDEGGPLPGATIVAKGNTKYNVVTDANGKFSISLPKSETTLLISYMGFQTQEVSVIGKSTINISLKGDAQELEAVIISGVAGKTSARKLTITVDHLSADDLNKVPASSASTALQGKVPGVTVTSAGGQPGSGSAIRLRGATSMLGNNEPLIIVDGVMVKTSLADFNSDDIESIEIVKGPAASALYGSRAAGGVVVITTKRGKSMKETYEIVVRNEVGVSKLAKEMELSSSHPYKLAADNDQFPYTKYEGVVYDNDGNVISGSRSLTDSGYSDQAFSMIRNHQKDFFKSGIFYTNYIGVGTKTNSSNLYFSFENHHNEGIIFGTDGYTRRNFRFNADTKIGKRFKLSTSNLYITSMSDKPGSNNSFYDLLFINPDVDLNAVNDDGSPYKVIPDPWSINENPLYPLHYRTRMSSKNTFMTNVKGTFFITDWLNWDAAYSYEKFNKYYNTLTPKGYLYGGQANIGGSIYMEQYSSKSQTIQTTLNFNRMFGDWVVKSKLSYMYEDEDYYDFSVTGRDFIVPGIPQLKNTDQTKSSTNSYDGVIRSINVFAIADVDYKGKYLFSGLIRRDGSSLFGENQRWHNYFRLAGAYRITEDYDIPGFQELKVRAAYGTSGLRPGYSWQYETYYFNNGQIYRDQLGNKDLAPSEARELEFALDAQFLKRFKFTASYSITNTIGAFAKVPLASHLGYPYQWRNVGDMKANVIELSLAVNALKTKDSRLDFRLNFDKVKQEMVNLSIPAYYTGPHSAYYINPGEAFGIIYGYEWVTSLDQMASQLPTGVSINDYEVNSDGYVIEKGTQGSKTEKAILVDEDGDGTADKIAIGDGNANFHMNLSTTYTYKGFTFYMLLDWKQGGDVYNYTHQYIFRDGRAIEYDQTGKADSDKKSNAYYSNFYQQSINSYFVEDGTYLKLRELSLFYTWKPKKKSSFVKSVKFGVIGRNLLTFTKYSGYDPEVASGGDLTTFAFDDFGYPNFRTISASLEFKF